MIRSLPPAMTDPGPKRRQSCGLSAGPVARGKLAQGERLPAETDGAVIVPRLPGRALYRACHGQAGAARFVDGQIARAPAPARGRQARHDLSTDKSPGLLAAVPHHRKKAP